MDIVCKPDKQSCGRAGAEEGLRKLREILETGREANIILATGLSQIDVLHTLAKAGDINWNRVNAFHLDEYIGLPVAHPASFRGVLWREFASRLPVPLRSFAWIDGETDPRAECDRLGCLLDVHPVDVAFIGIGENGHLAFNDPPANFATDDPYLVVTLDEACRRQQMGEGWFPTIEDVPHTAISMSVRQILRSRNIIVTVPDRRKAQAVKDTLEQPISNLYPATALRSHPYATMFLDADSASLLSVNPGPDGHDTVRMEAMPYKPGSGETRPRIGY